MKKAFLLASILLISVISTACINNFAVQELNNKAKAFMDKGDYVSAIERLKSSVDLDDSVFETQYNLAVAYTKAEDYENAIKAYNAASELNPDFADLYYSRAVCEENLAKDVISGELVIDENGVISKPKKNNVKEDTEDTVVKNSKLPDASVKVILEYLDLAKTDYQIYMDKSQSSSDKEEINNKLDELKKLAETYAK